MNRAAMGAARRRGRGLGGGFAGAGPAYDYVLAVGPSRSGTTFLYRALNAHPGFCAPEIKEGHYYRSPRRLERALGDLRGTGAMLLDVADTAWRDPRLDRVRGLAAGGVRTLLVVLVRRHRDRARSVMAWRRSRVWPAIPDLLPGRGGPGGAAERDALAAADLERIFALGPDVLAVEFDALAARPRAVLDGIARLCRTAPFGPVDAAPANPAVRARFAPLAAAAKLAAWALRAAGARRTLQALKDAPRLGRLVFRPVGPDWKPALAAAARLDRLEAECRAAVEAAGAPAGDGLRIVRGGGRRGPSSGDSRAPGPAPC